MESEDAEDSEPSSEFANSDVEEKSIAGSVYIATTATIIIIVAIVAIIVIIVVATEESEDWEEDYGKSVEDYSD